MNLWRSDVSLKITGMRFEASGIELGELRMWLSDGNFGVAVSGLQKFGSNIMKMVADDFVQL